MKRSIILMLGILTFCGIGLIASSATAIDGPQANATVSFGEFQTDLKPPLDRFVTTPGGGVGVTDALIPDNVTIKAGGAVNFIIGGGHVVTIYDDGTQPSEIDTTLLVPGITAAGGVIDDPDKRIYRGNSFAVGNDRVEVVQFSKPGTYLVICARFNHFVNSHMFGFVKVLPGSGK
jgi:plastocyanin